MSARKPKPLFWRAAIAAAKAHGGFLPSEQTKAGEWTTCACGEQDPRIPRREGNGEPLDAQLLEYGYEFWYAVGKDDAALAEAMLDRIEERAAAVLAELPR